MAISLSFRPRQDAMPTEEGSWHSDQESFSLRILRSDEEYRDAGLLRRRAFASLGFELENSLDRYDELQSTIVFGAYDGARLVATMRLCFSHPWMPLSTMPCAHYYPALKEVRLSEGGGFVEICRFAIEPTITNTSYRATLYGFMVRGAFTAAQAAGVSRILIAAKPEWLKFYKHMLGFTAIGVPAPYPPGDLQITLLSGTIDLAQTRQKMANRFFKITEEEVANMRVAVASTLAHTSDTSKIAV